jgi:uncharacterized protein (TIGR00369 family)
VLPWSKSCFICGEANDHGLQLRSRIEGDRVVLDHLTRESDVGWRHLVHGGILMTLLDEVMTWAAILSAKKACVAVEVTVRLKAPVAVGRRIRVEGWKGSGKSRVVVAEGRIVDEDGVVLATATGKYMAMPSDKVTFCSEDFVMGPDTVRLPFLE